MSIPAPAKRLLDFIAGYEAPRGYQTVYGNRMSQMPKPLTSMTVDEVITQGAWRTKTFGSSAAGAYQVMKKTLVGLKQSMPLTGRELFNADLQDRLGYALLLGRGYAKFMSGAMTMTAFGNQIAMEWASFPVLSAINGKRRGQSYYAGDGLNHVLVGPEPVERVLRSMRSAAVVGVADPQLLAAIQAPRVEAAPPTISLPWWQRLIGVKAKPAAATVVRPGLAPHGDPALWDVQAVLREKAYYTKGLLDGLDGGLTQGAVAQSRKDNGMEDGGIDAAFLARYQDFPQRPVSIKRGAMSIPAAAAHAPELFKPPGWLISAGLGSLGLGGASGAGLMDNVQGGVAKANDVFGQVQTAFGIAQTTIGFVVEHKTWFLVGAGLFLVWKGVSAVLGAVVKVRQAFF